MNHPEVPVSFVLDVAIDAMLGGSAGWIHIPPGADLQVVWVQKKRCYRLTIDVTAGHELAAGAGAFVEDTAAKIRRYEARRSGQASAAAIAAGDAGETSEGETS